MLECYSRFIETYHNGEKVSRMSDFNFMLDSNEAKEILVIPVDWDNVDDVWHKYSWGLPFSIWDFSYFHHLHKGKSRRISFDSIKHKDIKEWKSPLDIELHVIYKEYTPSLRELLNWKDPKEACQYMEEHNLRIC